MPATGKWHQFGLPDRLRAAREGAGIDQRTFADITGISKATIYNYESGRTTPRRPQLIAWAMATGYDLEWLTTGGIPGHEGLPRLDSNQEPSGYQSTLPIAV